ASDASKPKPLMAFAALFGKKAMITAAAMGSQRVMERMLLIVPPGSEMERWRPRRLARRRLAAEPPNPRHSLVNEARASLPFGGEDAAEPAGETPALRPPHASTHIKTITPRKNISA